MPHYEPAHTEAYNAWVAADRAWMAEIEREFGKRAGDARYDNRAVSTPKLRRLHGAFQAARNAWTAAQDRANATHQ